MFKCKLPVKYLALVLSGTPKTTKENFLEVERHIVIFRKAQGIKHIKYPMKTVVMNATTVALEYK